MRYNTIWILLFTFPFLYCSTNTSGFIWKVYNATETKLKKSTEQFNRLILKEDAYYLLGSRSNSFSMKDNKSIVYKSTDFGKSWKEIYSGNGDIIDGYFFSKNLYLFQEITEDNSLGNNHLSLLNANDKTSVIDFKKNSSIKGVFMDELGEAVIVLNNSFKSNDNSIFKSTNNFLTYDSLFTNKPIKKSLYSKKKIYLLTSEWRKENYKIKETNTFYIVNNDNIWDTIKLEFKVSDFIVDNNGKIWVIGKENSNSFLKCQNKKKFDNINIISRDENVHPQKLYKYDQFIAVLTSSIDKSLSGGFGGSEYSLYLSFDNGKSFIKAKIPISDFVNPISFYKDEKIVIYSGSGRISVCEIKK